MTIAGMAFALILIQVRRLLMSPAASGGRHSRGFLWPQVIQAIITAYLSHVIGKRAALTGSSSQENSDHAPLDPTPEEEQEDGLNNRGYIHPPIQEITMTTTAAELS